MSTRLGFSNTYDTARNNLQVRQTNLANLQENLTSGKKVVRSSDDPTGAAQAERALTRLSRIQTDQRALESQRNSIAMAESTLGDVTNALQSFRELTVSAGNATHTASERKTIALQLSGLRDQIFELANRKDTNGLPLFGALGSALAPFVGPTAPPADYRFDGLPGQSASSEVSIPFTLDGDSAFMHQASRDGVYNLIVSSTVTGTIPATRQLLTDSVNVPVTTPATVTGLPYKIHITGVTNTTAAGITTTDVAYDVYENPSDPFPGANAILSSSIGTASYPTAQPTSVPITGIPGMSFNISGTSAVGDTVTIEPNPSIFSVLDDAIRDIGGAANRNAASQAVAQALNNLDIGMARISAVRGQAGDLLNRADRITSNQEARSIQLDGNRSRAEDLDMIKGISDFQNQNTGYQAALQSYAQIQKLSLFNYIG
jgi:flagellar hook-associated protein 3 FlgL